MTPEQECKLRGASAAIQRQVVCPYATGTAEQIAWTEGYTELVTKTAQTREVMDVAVGDHSAAMWKAITAMEESFCVDGVKDNR